MKIATCTYLMSGGFALMGQQQRTILGFKGYGGKVELGQTIRGNAVEEIWEETGGKKQLRVTPEEEGGIFTREELLVPAGIIDFFNGTNIPENDPSFRVYFFLCYTFAGRPVDTVEMMHHQWFNKNYLPLDRLVRGDELFIPHLLQGQCIKGKIWRTEDWTRITNVDLEEVAVQSLDF